jgi:hypothetical protein
MPEPPDLGQPGRGASSFRVGFQSRPVRNEPVSRDAFAAVELVDTAPNLCIDRFPVFQAPAVLFFLGFEQTEQPLPTAGRATCLELFSNSRLQSRIADFEVQGPWGRKVRDGAG